jgi:acetyl-CoA acetyltransferase
VRADHVISEDLDGLLIAARREVLKGAHAHVALISSGVESMSQAPFVLGKAGSAFSRSVEIYDSTLGWRFVNPLMKQLYSVESMPETAEKHR